MNSHPLICKDAIWRLVPIEKMTVGMEFIYNNPPTAVMKVIDGREDRLAIAKVTRISRPISGHYAFWFEYKNDEGQMVEKEWPAVREGVASLWVKTRETEKYRHERKIRISSSR